MAMESVASLRMRAELARRLASQLSEPKAVASLREMAEALDAAAENIQNSFQPTERLARPKEI